MWRTFATTFSRTRCVAIFSTAPTPSLLHTHSSILSATLAQHGRAPESGPRITLSGTHSDASHVFAPPAQVILSDFSQFEMDNGALLQDASEGEVFAALVNLLDAGEQRVAKL